MLLMVHSLVELEINSKYKKINTLAYRRRQIVKLPNCRPTKFSNTFSRIRSRGWQLLSDSYHNIQRFLYSAKSVTSLVTSNDLCDMSRTACGRCRLCQRAHPKPNDWNRPKLPKLPKNATAVTSGRV